MNPQLLFRKILSDLRVEVLDEFNQNFTRKAFFDRPWPARKMDTGRGTLLVVSGAMRRSLRCTAARGSLYFSSELPLLQHPQPRRKSARYPGNAPLLLGDVLPQRPA